MRSHKSLPWSVLKKRGCPECLKPFQDIVPDPRTPGYQRALCQSGHCVGAIFDTKNRFVALEWYRSTEIAVIYFPYTGKWGNVSDGHLNALFKPFTWRISETDLYTEVEGGAVPSNIIEQVFGRGKMKRCPQCGDIHTGGEE